MMMGSTTTADIMVVRREVLDRLDLRDGLTTDPHVTRQFIDAVHSTSVTMPREKAESDLSMLQPIPLTCVSGSGRILVLPGDDRGYDDRLWNRYALWVGGHMDGFDASDSNPVGHCLSREISEELYHPLVAPHRLVGLVVAHDSEDLRPMHVGIVHRSDIADPALMEALAGPPNTGQRGSAKTVVLDRKTLLDIANRLEPWSRFLLAADDLWGDPALVSNRRGGVVTAAR
jgi:predicted NUDIX family phosphoesterase